MLPIVFLICSVSELSVAIEMFQNTSATVLGEKRNIKINQETLKLYTNMNNTPQTINKTHYGKEENQLRMPTKFYEEKTKKSKIIKSPKRTIQKIIKNGKSRSRKIYVHPVTRQQLKPTEMIEIAESNTPPNIAQLGTKVEHSHRKKARKSLKVARYPMPFHNIQTRKVMNAHKRNRRDVDRDDVFVIKDLDEIEFLSKENDNDVVRAHVQNYW